MGIAFALAEIKTKHGSSRWEGFLEEMVSQKGVWECGRKQWSSLEQQTVQRQKVYATCEGREGASQEAKTRASE